MEFTYVNQKGLTHLDGPGGQINEAGYPSRHQTRYLRDVEGLRCKTDLTEGRGLGYQVEWYLKDCAEKPTLFLFFGLGAVIGILVTLVDIFSLLEWVQRVPVIGRAEGELRLSLKHTTLTEGRGLGHQVDW